MKLRNVISRGYSDHVAPALGKWWWQWCGKEWCDWCSLTWSEQDVPQEVMELQKDGRRNFFAIYRVILKIYKVSLTGKQDGESQVIIRLSDSNGLLNQLQIILWIYGAVRDAELWRFRKTKLFHSFLNSAEPSIWLVGETSSLFRLWHHIISRGCLFLMSDGVSIRKCSKHILTVYSPRDDAKRTLPHWLVAAVVWGQFTWPWRYVIDVRMW